MSAGGMGGRIRTLRNAAGLNQTQLAGEAGVSQGTISDYEANRFDSPAAEIVLRIAIALKVDPVWLFFGKGMPGASAARTEDEANLLGLFRELDASGRGAVLGAARGAVEQMPEPSVADPFKTAPRVVKGRLLVQSPSAKYRRK